MYNELDEHIKQFQVLTLSAAKTMDKSYPFRTRRGGGAMGLHLEKQLGKEVNVLLKLQEMELGELPDQYNDYAVLEKDAYWDNETREGELFRVEVKSMEMDADESKAHFDVCIEQLNKYDMLVVLAWRWVTLPTRDTIPYVQDCFVSLAKPVAELRDELHLVRGGSFIDRADCPDGCEADQCIHHGASLNSKGFRETKEGPNSCRHPNTSYMNNFGGLVRMTGARTKQAKQKLKELRKGNSTIDAYMRFLERNFTGVK